VKYTRNLALLSLLVLLASCGGGGGGSSGSGSTGPTSLYTALYPDGAASRGYVAAGASQYYKIDVLDGFQLTFTLTTLSGDADLAIYSAKPLNQATLIKYSANNGTVTDTVNYTATQASTIYIEVGGYQSSQYSIEVTTAGSAAKHPALSASPPSDIGEGSNFTFRIFAYVPSDPSVNVDYRLLYGPSGMQVDNTGSVSWTAHGAVFSQSADMHYAVRVTSSNGYHTDYTGTVTVLDPAQAAPIVRSQPTLPANGSHMLTLDFDNDGIGETLVSDGQKHVYLLKNNNGQYEQSWMLPVNYALDGSFDAVGATDIDGDGYPEIILGIQADEYTRLGSAKLVVLDGRTRTLRAEKLLPDAETVHGIITADTDDDGNTEIVLLTTVLGSFYQDSRIYVLDAGSLATEWESGTYPRVTSIAAGQLDNDSYPEIALNTGTVLGFDGSSYVSEWDNASPFGSYIETADINHDGISEIVGYEAVWSMLTRSIAWTIPQDPVHPYTALATGNLDADPETEIVLGVGAFSDVVVFDYNPTSGLLEENGRIPTGSGTVRGINIGQLDTGPEPEILWASGSSFFVASAEATPTIDWSNLGAPGLDGPFRGGFWTELGPGDRRAAFITANTDGGYSGARIVTLDASGHVGVSASELGNSYYRNAVLAPADYNGDGQTDFLYASDQSYSEYYAAYDFTNDMTEWTSPLNDGQAYQLLAADMNGDGVDDAVARKSNNTLEIYDVLHDTLIASIDVPNGFSTNIVAADIDNDSRPELLFESANTLYIYGPDGSGGVSLERSRYYSSTYANHLAVGDLDGDGKPEIIRLFGYTNTITAPVSIHIVDSATLDILSSCSVLLDGIVDDLIVEPTVNPGRNLVVSLGDLASQSGWLVWLDPYTGALVSRSPDLIGRITTGGVHAADINGDNQPDLVIGTGEGMYITR
jgi:hypothetical protein